jgi:hypothetical protein
MTWLHGILTSWPECWPSDSSRTGGSLRFESRASPLARQAVAQMPSRMRDAFQRSGPVPARLPEGAGGSRGLWPRCHCGLAGETE